MCSGSEAGSYLRLIGFVYHSTLGFRVIKRESIRQGACISSRRAPIFMQGIAIGVFREFL